MKKTVINAARAVVLITGALFIFIGVSGGEFAAVLQKAVRICLECIGIG